MVGVRERDYHHPKWTSRRRPPTRSRRTVLHPRSHSSWTNFSGPVTYNGQGQTQRATGNGDTYQNGLAGITGQLDSAQNGAYFERAHEGTLVSERAVTGHVQTAEYFYYFDAVGSVLGLINASTGTTAATYTYDPYGRDTGTTGTAAAGNPFRYTGAYRDSTGLYKMGARYYDPAAARFTQTDPASHPGDLFQGNRYTYAGDDPFNFTDPTGAYGEYTSEFSQQGGFDYTRIGVACANGAIAGAAIGFFTGPGAAVGAVGGCLSGMLWEASAQLAPTYDGSPLMSGGDFLRLTSAFVGGLDIFNSFF